MSVLIDTNVISDLLFADEQWEAWSRKRIAEFSGQLKVNAAIFTELCYHAESAEEVATILSRLKILYMEMPKEGLFLTAQAYKKYRELDGKKTAPLPDFFIGGHAASIGVPLITRDVARYKTYFPQVKLIHP